MMYGDQERSSLELPPPDVPRVEVIDELAMAVWDNVAPRHDGDWATATLEVCLAILESAKTGKDVELSHQCAPAA